MRWRSRVAIACDSGQRMKDREISSAIFCDTFSELLGLEPPWQITHVEVLHERQAVKVHVSHQGGKQLRCPSCGAVCPGYDRRSRKWRYLDTMDYRTYLVGEVPRVECPEHSVLSLKVPWAEVNSRFT